MKTALLALVLGFGVVGSASASTNTDWLGRVAAAANAAMASGSPTFEAANRKGSTRVGGSGRSGKGGHYVGGRKR